MVIRDLFKIVNSITPALDYFERGKIDRFKKRYAGYINDANMRLYELNNEFIVSENGKLKTENGKFVFLDGKTEAEFEERRDKILSKPV